MIIISGWALIGVITLIWIIFHDYKLGKDLNLGEFLGLLFVCPIGGVLSFIWVIKLVIEDSNILDTTILKGK